jgi:UDP-N-acetylglucosamine 4-epimerase
MNDGSIRYQTLRHELEGSPRHWLVTGAAGFIGSHLTEELLRLGQTVVGLDNFATGHRSNLDDVARTVGAEAFKRFTLIEGDIADRTTCAKAVAGVDIVLHQAALGSVPRSIEDPITSHRANVDGFINMLDAARQAGAARGRQVRFVYASSSSVYGDSPELPKVETRIGRPLSPYAATKACNEVYANSFRSAYNSEVVGLRYFNVFGPRQDPNGAYAAVIPRWIGSLLQGEGCQINGDGLTSRDFCFVEDVVQANLLAATTDNAAALGRAFNVAVGDRTTLNDLFLEIKHGLESVSGKSIAVGVSHGEFRPGDVAHSLANIEAISEALGYRPVYRLRTGLEKTVKWYSENYRATAKS